MSRKQQAEKKRLQDLEKNPNKIKRKYVKKPKVIEPRIDIDAEVFSAKLGNKKAFNNLWDLYKPIIVRNADRFCILHKGFEQYRGTILFDSYVFLWDIINNYDFHGPVPFSYYVSEQLLEKTKQRIKGNKRLPEELIDGVNSNNDLNNCKGYKSSIPLKHRITFEDLREQMKLLLTAKQLQAIYYYHYLKISQENSAEKIGIAQPTFRKRLKKSYRKLRRRIRKLKLARMPMRDRKLYAKNRKVFRENREKQKILMMEKNLETIGNSEVLKS